MPIFEITGDDIALLDDQNLREVVARLCEAELRQRCLSPAYVTWGGNQNAADGGIDVRVALPGGTVIDGFIPRAATGFQVKQEDLPPSKIGEKMRSRDRLRPSIQALADENGAYIIVSSQRSTGDIPLTKRREAIARQSKASPTLTICSWTSLTARGSRHGSAVTRDSYPGCENSWEEAFLAGIPTDRGRILPSGLHKISDRRVR